FVAVPDRAGRLIRPERGRTAGYAPEPPRELQHEARGMSVPQARDRIALTIGQVRVEHDLTERGRGNGDDHVVRVDLADPGCVLDGGDDAVAVGANPPEHRPQSDL